MIARRSPMMEGGVRLITPAALAVGIYLLFAGHNNPGGGFAAGLVFGAVVILRNLADIQEPRHGREFVALGLLGAALVAAAPVVGGGLLFDQVVVDVELPVLGKVKSGGALPFDIAVSAIVVGLVIALLDGLEASRDDRSRPPIEDDE